MSQSLGLNVHKFWSRALGIGLWCLILAVTGHFLLLDVLKFVVVQQSVYGSYWDSRYLLALHLTFGTAALLIAPVQFVFAKKLGGNKSHRVLGWAYAGSIVMSALAAVPLAAHSTVGWTVTVSLMTLNVFWVVTTGVAVVAARMRQVAVHRQWMVRSYLITLAFVFFRLVRNLPLFPSGASFSERTTVAIWLAWALPVMGAELVFMASRIWMRHMAPAAGESRRGGARQVLVAPRT